MEDRLEIRLSGTGGQGLILAGMILSDAVVLEGKWAAQSQSYEPLSRGGSSRADVVISSEEVDYPLVTEPDFLLVLDPAAVETGPLELASGGTVLLDRDLGRAAAYAVPHRIELPLVATARGLGNPRVANIVALGALTALTDVCRRDSLETAIRRRSPRGFEAINLEAMEAGHRLGAEAR
jgi:2-oxoglutarate ferredoxin oxidoreductase subunit gamma